MKIVDDRLGEQLNTYTWLIVGTDRAMSGWGEAAGGTSYAAWACKPDDRKEVLEWVERRSDMLRVREVASNWRPRGKGHTHIYVVDESHPAIARKRAFAAECAAAGRNPNRGWGT